MGLVRHGSGAYGACRGGLRAPVCTILPQGCSGARPNPHRRDEGYKGFLSVACRGTCALRDPIRQLMEDVPNWLCLRAARQLS